MKKSLLWLICFWLGLAASAFSLPVNIVLQDSTVVSGEMLGANETSVFLNENGKAREIRRSYIREVFNAQTNEPLKWTQLKSSEPEAAPAPAATPVQEIQVKSSSSGRPGEPLSSVSIQENHSWFLLDIGMDMGLGPDNGQVLQLWKQLVPPQCSQDLNRFFVGLDTDFMVRIFDWWAIGPFFNWMFMSPGLNSELDYSGGGYWVYYGGYWYYYDYGHQEVNYSLDFNNITYGLATRFNVLTSPGASLYIQLNAGYLNLAGGYEVQVNGTEKQRADFEGSCPYTKILVGLDAGDRTGRIGVQVGYQKALVQSVTARIVQNDYFPQEEGTTVPVLDSRNGSNIQVDYSGPVFLFFGSFYF